MEIEAIASVDEHDVVQAISELPVHEISDIFMRVVEKLNNPDDITTMVKRMMNHCIATYGSYPPSPPG